MRRILTTAVTAVVVATTGFTVVSCDAVDKAMDCASTAVAIARSVDDLKEAVSNAVDDPQKARQALDNIDDNLDKMEEDTDHPEVNTAVKDLNKAVHNARSDLNDGKVPEVVPVVDAADDLKDVCTPG